MMALNISEYMAANTAPRRAVVLGKGPSLNLYDPARYAGEFVVALNEAGETFPCNLVFFVDKRQNDLELAPDRVPVRPINYQNSHGGRGYYWRRGESWSCLGFATAPNAFAFLGEWGVRELLCFGFDAYDGIHHEEPYADCLDRVLKPRASDDYTRINTEIANALEHYRVTTRFAHRGDEFRDCRFIVGTHYSEGGIYEHSCFPVWERYVRKVGVPYRAFPFPDRGDWQANVRPRAGFIRQWLDELPPDKGVLWLDVDAVLWKFPALINNVTTDVALHRFYDNQYQPGTLFCNNTDGARRFLERWQKHQDASAKRRETFLLNDMIPECGDVTITDLPAEYCKIYHHPQHAGVASPVIEHFQASRQLKNYGRIVKMGEIEVESPSDAWSDAFQRHVMSHTHIPRRRLRLMTDYQRRRRQRGEGVRRG